MISPLLSIPVLATRTLKKKQNGLLHGWNMAISRHGAKDSLEIGRITSMGHQVQPAPSFMRKASILTADAISIAGQGRVISYFGHGLPAVVEQLAEVKSA
jgi:hypothetical protein